ncbi:S8 family serine peptidase [Nostocaceae cyanobacterium CENA357]|uniref:S8 family serine peptidase n=1 Tax=Atlanticothrix silvestris CENA357 TaxID=1725252 RepID=A0A8J7HFI7_9CYAN|nr:CARDB domain-containing protein [Atlanticothrix silvestris]MBH8551586.1 S8 family serine peptidase [Atlanticothrix silvestris CENA357]
MLYSNNRNIASKIDEKNITLNLSKNSGLVIDYENDSSLSLSSGNTSTSINRSSSNLEKIYAKTENTDTSKSISQSNLSNNITTQALQPDLIVRNTSNPSSGVAGGTIQVSYEIENQGYGNAGYSFTKFYLSKDLTLGSDDPLLGSDYVGSIPSGYYSPESITLTISSSIATGTYYLVYQTDGYSYVAESNENNNAVAGTIKITKPDLIVQNAVAPTSASVGSTIQLSYQIKNQGAGSAGSSSTYFYLSKDKTLSSNDVYVGSDYINGIAAGVSRAETASLNIGSSIAAGSYYLLYQADGYNNVAESSEGNNVVARAITIKKADLIVQNAVAPSSASVGSTIQLSYQIKNQGSGSAGSSSTYFYLSKDNVLSSTDIYLGSDYINSIAAGVSRAETASLNIGSSIAAGSYYLLYQADGYKDVAESSEGNNVIARAITITATGKPDLVIQNASAPTKVGIGTTIQLSYQVKNQGNSNADYSSTYFYISKDKNVSNDDVYLGSDYVSSLAVSGVSSESTSFYFYSKIAGGSYYLLYKADGSNLVSESNENNNILAKAITITAPDLVIPDASAPTKAAIGTTIKISYQLKNQGNANAGASDTYFYLSRDQTFGNDDISIGYDSENSVAVAASAVISQSTTWTIDKTIASGKYYLLLKADAYGDVTEGNETNNSVYITESITLTPINGGGFNSTTGYGLINAAAAVAKAIGKSTFADVLNLGGENWGADLIKAPEVWAKGYTGQGIVVAVVDSGVDRNHPDLKANIWKNSKEIASNGKDDDGNGYIDDVYGWNFVNKNNNTLDLVNGHGTHVAGTIAGVKNSFGVTGIAHNAKIMPVKVFDDDGKTINNAIPNGIRYAVDNGADVINLSLSSSESYSELKSAIQYAASKGVITVSAASNEGELAPRYPARYANQWGLAVGAISYNKVLTDFSNRAGTTPLTYITAPGDDIYSTYPSNNYEYMPGTSMAAPHVAGVVALILSAKKGLTPAKVRQIIMATSGNGVKPSSSTSSLSASSTSSSKIATSSLSVSSTNARNPILSSLISNNSTESKVAIPNLSSSSNQQNEITISRNHDKFVDTFFWRQFVKSYQSTDSSPNNLAIDADDIKVKPQAKKHKQLLEDYHDWLRNLGGEIA